MNVIIKVKKKASAPRRPNRSANVGMAKQPRMVAKATSMVAYEASCAACGPTRPPASASAMTAVGTYTVPAHSPQIETNMNNEFKIVRRRHVRLNSVARGRHHDQV